MKKKQQATAGKVSAVSLVMFAAVTSACLVFLALDLHKIHTSICKVNAIDQVTGLVEMDCIRK